LRQSPCAHFEANVLYLLVGTRKALLIDTGAIADTAAMPLTRTVLELLPGAGHAKLPLLVVHTHGHADHRAGGAQLAALPALEFVPTGMDEVRAFFGFDQWPNGEARLDLGGRSIAVIPTPGHHPAHLVFYDDRTGLLFSGDFLLPGRLLIEDAAAYQESARRVVDFLAMRPLVHVLGGHIELDAGGRAYAHGARHHPNERPLELTRAELQALPAALANFNGFYARHANYILTNPLRNLLALASAALALLVLIALSARGWLRRRRRNLERQIA
jgi:glyoxylase-like metal-dependent hydrolase (beta-lactamase superfamily II)